MEPNQPPPLPVTPPRAPLNWLGFFLVLLAPAALALLGAATKIDGLAIGAPLIGGAISGIACGAMIAARLNRPTGPKIALGILFALLIGGLSFALGFAGCMVGGFKMDFH